MVLCPDRLDVLSVLCRSQFYFPIHSHRQLPPENKNKTKIKQTNQDRKFFKMSLHSRGWSCPTAMRARAMCAFGISMLSLPIHKLFYHPCSVSSHILASSTRTLAAVDEEEEEEGVDQARGSQLSTQLRDKAPHRGPWPDYTSHLFPNIFPLHETLSTDD